MPARERTKPFKPEPDAIVVAHQGAAVELPDGSSFTVAKGARLRGSHPAVRALGSRVFALDGTPQSELPGRFDGILLAEEIEQANRPNVAPRIDPLTPLRDLRLCTRSVIASVAGTADQGSIYAATDPVVLEASEAFVPLAEHL